MYDEDLSDEAFRAKYGVSKEQFSCIEKAIPQLNEIWFGKGHIE